MMRLAYPCKKDEIVFEVSKLDPQIQILSVVINCPTCGNPITISNEPQPSMKSIVLTAIELFQASNGLGLPDIQCASLSRVNALMLGATIIGVGATEVTPTRVLLDHMLIENMSGRHRVAFGISTRGATIFKIVEE